MRYLLWNVCGLTSKLSHLRDYVESQNLDAVFIQETRVNQLPSELELLFPSKNWFLAFSPCNRTNSNGSRIWTGGLLTIIRKKRLLFDVKIEDLSTDTESTHYISFLKPGTEDLYLTMMNIYAPPSLCNSISLATLDLKPSIFLGDTNTYFSPVLDNSKPQRYNQVNALVHNNEYNLLTSCYSFSRELNNSTKLGPDNILIRRDVFDRSGLCTYIPVDSLAGLSDHLPIHGLIDCGVFDDIPVDHKIYRKSFDYARITDEFKLKFYDGLLENCHSFNDLLATYAQWLTFCRNFL